MKIENDAIYAVFLDIDGTLIDRGRLPQENVRAIARAQAAGHKVFLNTGRSYSFIPHAKLASISFDGICAGCGSDIRVGDEVLYSEIVDHAFIKRVCEYYLESGRTLFLEGEDACFWVNAKNSEKAYDMLRLSNSPCYEITDVAQLSGEFSYPRISKLSYWGTDITERELEMWREGLRVIVHPTYVESVIYGCDKARAMERMLSRFQIPREHSIAMGDSANDHEMLKYAGISVAVGNATESTKQICSYISSNASDAGVAAAIYELLQL